VTDYNPNHNQDCCTTTALEAFAVDVFGLLPRSSDTCLRELSLVAPGERRHVGQSRDSLHWRAHGGVARFSPRLDVLCLAGVPAGRALAPLWPTCIVGRYSRRTTLGWLWRRRAACFGACCAELSAMDGQRRRPLRSELAAGNGVGGHAPHFTRGASMSLLPCSVPG